MLSAYIQLNGPELDDSFTAIIHGPSGFFTLWDAAHSATNYGNDVEFLLFGFYVEGSFGLHMPDKITLGRFSSTSRSIRITVPVTRTDFHNCDDRQRRLFVAHAVELGVELAAARHAAKRDTDFQRLLHDVAETSRRYISRESTVA